MPVVYAWVYKDAAKVSDRYGEEEKRLYEAYIFDLYGTLADIHTDEEMPYLWKKMSEIYGALGAFYEPEELRGEFRRLEMEQTELLQKSLEEAQDKRLEKVQENTQQKKLAAGVKGAAYQEQLLAEPDLTRVFAQLYEQKGRSATEELASMTAITFRALSREYLSVYPGVKETLTALRQKGKKVYLLSNAQRDFTRPELKMLGLSEYFDGILISSEEGVKKPSKLFFDRLLERYGLDPETCLMVGNDENSDIEGAIRAGMDSLYIHTEISPELATDSRATFCVMSGGFEKAAELYLLKWARRE